MAKLDIPQSARDEEDSFLDWSGKATLFDEPEDEERAAPLDEDEEEDDEDVEPDLVEELG